MKGNTKPTTVGAGESRGSAALPKASVDNVGGSHKLKQPRSDGKK